MTAVAEATIGHNSAAVGEILAKNPAALFQEKGLLDALIDSIEKEIASHKPDLSTEKSRKAIASLAFSIAKRKTAYDAAGKDLNEDLRKQINTVDVVRKQMRDTLDALRNKARDPLTRWEKAEDDRQEAVGSVRMLLADALNVSVSATLDMVAADRARIEALEIDPTVFLDFTDLVESEKVKALASLDDAKARLEAAEAERAELARLRAEKEAAERDAAERVAKEAAARAEADRIETASKRAAEEAAAAERQKAQEAEAAAERKRAAERAEAEAAAAEDRRKAQAALDQANRERAAAEAALAAEHSRKAAEERAEAERKADQEHRSNIMRAAKEAIMEHGGIDEDAARKIVLAIGAGSVPNVTLRF